MQHHAGAVFHGDGAQTAQLAHVGGVVHALHQWKAALQFLLQRVGGVLGHIHAHQPGHAKARHLAAQLGTDGAAGAGHQHGLAAEQAAQALRVELHRRAAQQIFQPHLARQGRAAGRQQFGEARQQLVPDAVPVIVVDVLEAVEVEEGTDRRSRRAGLDLCDQIRRGHGGRGHIPLLISRGSLGALTRHATGVAAGASLICGLVEADDRAHLGSLVLPGSGCSLRE